MPVLRSNLTRASTCCHVQLPVRQLIGDFATVSLQPHGVDASCFNAESACFARSPHNVRSPLACLIHQSWDSREKDGKRGSMGGGLVLGGSFVGEDGFEDASRGRI